MDSMLIILARGDDDGAAWLANRWRSHDAVVMSPADLSQEGWVHYVGSPESSRVRIGGREVGEEEIRGVLVRIASVAVEDLGDIVEADRPYVAAEMTAFLLEWLSGLTCPVLNQPTAQSLGGPTFRQEQWVHFASKLGIRCAPVRRNSVMTGATPVHDFGCELRVVGELCFGGGDPTLIKSARQLAKNSGADLLSVSFSGCDADSEFVSASPWPDLGSPDIADAVLSCFKEKRSC